MNFFSRFTAIVILGLLVVNGSSVMAEKIAQSRLVMTESNSYMRWDSDRITIQLFDTDQNGRSRFKLHLQGKVLAKKMKSFAYQYQSSPATSLKVGKTGASQGVFTIDVLIDQVPSVVRLWLEVTEGKAVHLETFEVKIEKDDREFDQKKLINY
jgi:hypothetical protein